VPDLQASDPAGGLRPRRDTRLNGHRLNGPRLNACAILIAVLVAVAGCAAAPQPRCVETPYGLVECG